MSGSNTTGLPSRDSAISRQLVRSSAAVAVGTALSRVTGFLRVSAIATLGFGPLTDVYNIANNTPNIIYELLLGGVLTATLVPLYVQYLDNANREAINAINTVALTVLLVITVLAIAFAPWIIKPYFIGIDRPTRAAEERLAVDFLRLFAPQIFFYGTSAIAAAMLNARRRFVAAAFAPVLNNVVVICVFLIAPHVISDTLSVETVSENRAVLWLFGLGTTAGIAVMAIALLPALHRAGLASSFSRRWRHPAVKTMVRLSGWTIGYVITNQIAFWIVMVLAYRESGDTSAYLAAFIVFQLPHGLFAVTIMTTLMPELSAAAVRHDTDAFRHQFASGLRLIGLVIVPSACVMATLARPIVNGVLDHGDFTSQSAALSAETLAAFGGGLVFFSVYLYTLRAFYALHDTRKPFVLNCWENAINIVLAFALYPTFGVQGLAAAWSLAYLFAAAMALVALRRRIGSLETRRTLQCFRKIIIGAVGVTVVSFTVGRIFGTATTMASITTTVIGIAVSALLYIGVLYLFKVEELLTLINAFRRQKPAPT